MEFWRGFLSKCWSGYKTMYQQLIPARNCVVNRNWTRANAYDEILKWVQEQGVEIGNDPADIIGRVSMDLLVYWDNMPQHSTSVEFAKVAYRHVRHRYILTEWRDAVITII